MTFKPRPWIDHMRRRPGMYGYSPELFFSNLIREIVFTNPNQTEEIHVFNHQDSIILRLFGKDIEPNATDFLLSHDWTMGEPKPSGGCFFPDDFHLWTVCMLAWGKYFRFKSIRGGIATQILFKQSQFQKRCTFPTKQPDGWEFYFKLDPELPSNHPVKDFQQNNWLDTMLKCCSAFHPQYNFKHQGILVSGSGQNVIDACFKHEQNSVLGFFRSENFDCVIGYSPERRGLQLSSFANGFATPSGGSHEKYFTRLLRCVCRKDFAEFKGITRKLRAVINYKEGIDTIFFSRAACSELGSKIKISSQNRINLENFIKECLGKI